ncbi:hypothetical protein Pcinc_025396 [Petrolisthes cinctipes]|uniref:Uncharacterized protein n=1 Tax=Petrolisthes cinctipes TaxID=88211 RepID=A0AAE1KC05_PETCI|nr:hypothetical protein Pcinc_025396 [Petrolisthes cinctipes]
MDLHEVFDFKKKGLDNVIEKVTEDSVTIRTNIRTRDDFKKWNEVYMAKTHSRFNSKRLRSVGERKLFREVLICHHGVKHKGVKKTYTGCQVHMDVTIRTGSKNSLYSDKLMKEYPCFIIIKDVTLLTETEHAPEKSFFLSLTETVQTGNERLSLRQKDTLPDPKDMDYEDFNEIIPDKIVVQNCESTSCPSPLEKVNEMTDDDDVLGNTLNQSIERSGSYTDLSKAKSTCELKDLRRENESLKHGIQDAEELKEMYESQCLKLDQKLCKLREQKEMAELMLKERSQKLLKQIECHKQDRAKLEEQRRNDMKGFQTEIKFVKNDVKALVHQLYKITMAVSNNSAVHVDFNTLSDMQAVSALCRTVQATVSDIKRRLLKFETSFYNP